MATINTVNKYLSIKRYTCLAILLLCGLTCLLSSCVENIIETRRSGEMVVMKFNLDYGIKGESTVSRSLNHQISEAMVIPLADGFNLYATLEADPPEVKTRANIIFAAGTKLRIAAYEGGSTLLTRLPIIRLFPVAISAL